MQTLPLYRERKTTRVIRGCYRNVITRTYTGVPDDDRHGDFLESRFSDFPYPSDEWEWRWIGGDSPCTKYSFIADEFFTQDRVTE